MQCITIQPRRNPRRVAVGEGVRSEARLLLTNPHSTGRTITFKIKTNAASNYRVGPSLGVLAPGQTASVRIVMASEASERLRESVDEATGHPLPCKDKFMVTSVSLQQEDLDAMAAGGAGASLGTLWGRRDWKSRSRQAKLTVRVYRHAVVSDDEDSDDGSVGVRAPLTVGDGAAVPGRPHSSVGPSRPPRIRRTPSAGGRLQPVLVDSPSAGRGPGSAAGTPMSAFAGLAAGPSPAATALPSPAGPARTRAGRAGSVGRGPAGLALAPVSGTATPSHGRQGSGPLPSPSASAPYDDGAFRGRAGDASASATPLGGRGPLVPPSPVSVLPPLAVGAVAAGRPIAGRDGQLTGRSAGGRSAAGGLSLALSARSAMSIGSYGSATTGGRSYGSVALDAGAGMVASAELFRDGGFASVPMEGLPRLDGFAWRAGPELGRGISGHVHVGLRLGGAVPGGGAASQASLIAVKMVEVATVAEQRSLEREVRVLRALRHPNIVRRAPASPMRPAKPCSPAPPLAPCRRRDATTGPQPPSPPSMRRSATWAWRVLVPRGRRPCPRSASTWSSPPPAASLTWSSGSALSPRPPWRPSRGS